MLLSFGSTIKKVCELLEKNKGISLSFEIVDVHNELRARFRLKDFTPEFYFECAGSQDAFSTDPKDMIDYAGGEFDIQCGANKVKDPIQKIYLRTAYGIYDRYNWHYNRFIHRYD